MRRGTVAVIVMFLLLILLGGRVTASELASIGFEGFTIASFDSGASTQSTTWVKIATFQLAVSSPRYLAGVTVDWSVASTAGQIKVVVNGVESAPTSWEPAGDHLTPFGVTGVYGTSFTIEVYGQVSVDSNDNPGTITLNKVYTYTLGEDYAIKSKLTSLKYIPPGADNTPTALVLNRTEVLLPQTYNLSEGAISFWVKWDGTENVVISDNIGIDDSGFLYVKSDNGVTYALEGVTLPIGVYVPVYIGWKNGEGYIMVNSTRIMLSWGGNLIISKIGNLGTDSNTLVDEFRLYDTYIPYSAFEQGTDVAQVHVAFPNATVTLNITTMDGSSIDSLKLSAYSSNWTLLDTATWELGQTPTLTVPDKGAFVVIESSTASTTVYVRAIDGTLNVAIPGTSAQYVSASIEPASYPSQEQRVWEWLIVRDSQGNLIYRNKWDFTATDVVLKSGGTYLIEVATADFNQSQVVYTGLASPTIKINLPQLSALTAYSELTTYYRLANDTLQIYYYDPEGRTDNITLILYDSYNRVLLSVTYPNTNLLNFKTTIIPYRFVLSFERDGHNATWPIIVGHINEGNDYPFFLPKEVTSLLLVLMMLFSFTALSASWAPVMTLVMASALAVGGIVTVPAEVATFLSIGGFLAFMSQANLNFLSIKQLASQMVVVLLLLQIGGGIAGYIATETGIGVGGVVNGELKDNAIEQLVFWQNYTPQYTDLGVPVPTDASPSVSFLNSILKGGKFVFMALGAPAPVADLLQYLMYLLMVTLLLYIYIGREV